MLRGRSVTFNRGFAFTRASPESGLTISEEVSTAWNAPAEMDFSSSRTSFDHPTSEAPPKYQFDPLSATIMP
jgi:hypothetical protein